MILIKLLPFIVLLGGFIELLRISFIEYLKWKEEDDAGNYRRKR